MHAYMTYAGTNEGFAGRTIAARVRAYRAFNVGVDIDGGGRRGQERPRSSNHRIIDAYMRTGIGYQPKSTYI